MFNSDAGYIQKILAQFHLHVELELPTQARHLVNDTRMLNAGDIFCAINGTAKQGKDYIAEAINKGCHLVLVECEEASRHGMISKESVHPENSKHGDATEITVIEFHQLNKQLFALAKAFYQQPQNDLAIIGITGTNGKTSTSQMVTKLLAANGKTCSVIGTNGAGHVENLTAIANTTPGATELHQLLQSFVEQKQQYVAMEVSSHALEQGRVTAQLFNTAVFTNLTRDHLDYHQTMSNYAQAKYQIFTQNNQQVAVINGDDAIAQQWISALTDQQSTIVYGRSASIEKFERFARATNIDHQANGVQFTLSTHLGSIEITSALLGDFNIDNLLAAIAVLMNENISLSEIQASVETLTPVIGRMEAFSAADLPLAVVDYAHTPDALENALQACRQHCHGKLWVVFGCGGDRDVGKRSLMGEIAESHSDQVIVTNDNPRTEQPQAIANDILSGCKHPEKITVMLERQQAVISALKQADKSDVVLLAGKGHEDYIIVGQQHIPYNERELVRSIYAHGANA